jgi:hypothetical protein
MKLKSMVSAVFKLAIFSVLITSATEARADIERESNFYNDGNPFPNDDQDAWCTEADVPWACVSATDKVNFTFDGRWGVGGYAEAHLYPPDSQISPGDHAWITINVLCDGQWYQNVARYTTASASTLEITCHNNSSLSEVTYYFGIEADTAS